MYRDFVTENLPSSPISWVVRAEFKKMPESEDLAATMRGLAQRFISNGRLSGWTSLPELALASQEFLTGARLSTEFLVYGMVLLSNEVQKDRLSRIPFENRLLLLPYCLRDTEKCQGTFIAGQLFCAGCNRCSLGVIKRQAEKLGYYLLIAEDMSLIYESILLHGLDAVVGVSCLDRLLEIFPLIAENNIHGVAVPLLRDGCRDTAVDLAAVLEAIRFGPGPDERTIFPASRKIQPPPPVESHYPPERHSGTILAFLGEPSDITEQIAFDWVRLGGKRIRALLVIHTYAVLAETGIIPDSVAQVALAVEIFHKASLIHDDIEDDELCRYGQPALHRRYPMPVALNAGDYLIGKGYDLLTSVAPEIGVEKSLSILKLFSACHVLVARGQGEELFWEASADKNIDLPQVLHIYAWKTSQFFKLSLLAGIVLAGGSLNYFEPLIHRFSENIGIAYQILDDLIEFVSDGTSLDIAKAKPTLLYALALEHADQADTLRLQNLFAQQVRTDGDITLVREIYWKYQVPERAKEQALTFYSQAKMVLEEMRGDRIARVLDNLVEYRIRRKIDKLNL